MKLYYLAYLTLLIPCQMMAADSSGSPCAKLNEHDRQRIMTHLADSMPGMGDAITMPSLGNAHQDPVLSKQCILFVAKNCPGEVPDASGKLDPLCAKARDAHGPLMLMSGLFVGEGACGFVKSAEEIISAVDDPVTRMRWCFYYAWAGGQNNQCLADSGAAIMIEQNRQKHETAAVANLRTAWMAGFAKDFAHPRYHQLLPALKKLSKTAKSPLADAIRLSVAVQTSDR